MRRLVKVKTPATHTPLRKAAMTASSVSRRAYPAWIAADESGVAFSVAVTPRVRDGLVLRAVAKKKATKSKGPSDDRGTR